LALFRQAPSPFFKSRGDVSFDRQLLYQEEAKKTHETPYFVQVSPTFHEGRQAIEPNYRLEQSEDSVDHLALINEVMEQNKSFQVKLQLCRNSLSQEAPSCVVVLHSEPQLPGYDSMVLSSNENTFGTPQVVQSEERKGEEEEIAVAAIEEKTQQTSKMLSRISELESRLEQVESEKGEASKVQHEREVHGLRQEIEDLNMQVCDMQESIKSLLEDLHRCN